MPENKSSLMGFFQVSLANECQKKEGNHKIEVAPILTFVSRLEYTWRVAPQHCPLPIIQQSKVENKRPIMMLFHLKIQPPKCPLLQKGRKNRPFQMEMVDFYCVGPLSTAASSEASRLSLMLESRSRPVAASMASTEVR